jgi:hypothetical protein
MTAEEEGEEEEEELLCALLECRPCIAVINQFTYSIAVINQCIEVYSMSAVYECSV